ncbi:serpin family protein [Streptomyces sp. NPDC018693]|uniref:serpin family protein n=1 Tax=unclassified Streptomyces TaxID=2593676 RepID=UPI0037A60265
MRVANVTIRAVNGLTARWAATLDPDSGSVLSAAGVWPLLAFLADGAGGPARRELADAVGTEAGQAAGAARELLTAMGSREGLDIAVGLWTKRTVELREEWVAGLPAGAHGVLTGELTADREALDAWAAKATGGLIPRMPLALTDATLLVPASGLALRTQWLRPFVERPLAPEAGPWSDRLLQGLCRRSELLDRIGVADTPLGHVTELKVHGDNGVDVHLLLGEESMTPGQVLGTGVDLLTRRHPLVPGNRLPHGEVGPGLSVVRRRGTRPDPPTLDVTTVAYDIAAEHDLLRHPALFGLDTARDAARGHFPGISAFPLAVQEARQSAMSRFGARGFRAAAVTMVPAAAGAAPPPVRWVTSAVEARFDRPFGFLAVNRQTRLVLAAGWVTDPEPYREDEYQMS